MVLITVDTLRADRTGPYSADSTRTPNIAKLARGGTLFEAAISPMQMTRPSHSSLFTSLYPRDHGVVNNKISLESGFTSMAEVFRDHGYDTAAPELGPLYSSAPLSVHPILESLYSTVLELCFILLWPSSPCTDLNVRRQVATKELLHIATSLGFIQRLGPGVAGLICASATN